MSAPGFGEIIVILIVALIVFGPRKLPEMARTLGKSVREFRRASSSLRAELESFEEEEEETPAKERWDGRRRTRHPRAADNGSPAAPAPDADQAPDDADVPTDPAERRTGGGPD